MSTSLYHMTPFAFVSNAVKTQRLRENLLLPFCHWADFTAHLSHVTGHQE